MKRELSFNQCGELLSSLQVPLEAKTDQLRSLAEMERTGGELDMVGVKSDEFVFMDCAPESPSVWRSV